MSGSRLGRGRGGRLAVYGGCGVVVILLVFLYRAATSEMARLRELHVQCAHQQEALAAQLQVIFEYKVRLEKSLAEEKSSNAAVKQELQQRASREKSLRDKDSVEAMQRFNSLQQNFKLLQTEHQDLQEECKKREKQALEDMGRLESTLKELRSSMKQAKQEQHSLERLKTKYLELETEKGRLEEKYNDLLKLSGNNNGTIDHLKKEVFQLKRELEDAKKSSSKATSPGSSPVSPQSSQQVEQPALKGAQASANERNVGVQHQVSRPHNEDANPSPLRGPQAHHAIGDALSKEEEGNDAQNNVGFAQKGLNIVPVGRIENDAQEQKNSLPLPYNYRKKTAEAKVDREAQDQQEDPGGINDPVEDEQRKQVIPPPDNDETARNNDKDKVNNSKVQPSAVDDELAKLESQSPASSSTAKSAVPSKSEGSTRSSGNPQPGSTSQDKAVASKPKAKLPVGVVPIPKIPEKADESAKREESAYNQIHKNVIDSKENDHLGDAGNLVAPFAAGQSAGRHVGGQILDRRANPAWLGVGPGPGVQEFGEDLNQRIDEPGDRQADAGDENENYDADYDKEPPKNNNARLGGAEDEGEEEDEQDYVQNMNQDKQV